MQKRNVLESPRLQELKKHRNKVLRNKILLFFSIFLIFFIAIGFLSNLKSLSIKDVQIVGNKIIDTESLNKDVLNQISGKYFFIFPKNNIIYYPENTIKKVLQNDFPRIKDINISLKNNRVLTITLTERTATHTWCGANIPSTQINSNKQKCYFMDENGYIFDEAPYFSGEVYFKFFGLNNQTNPIGSYYFKNNFNKLIYFKDALISMSLKPIAVYITPDNEINVFLSSSVTNQIEPKIILSTDADFQNVAENLQAALNTEPLKTKFTKNYSNLEYIDLRFENKVYDKFKN